MFIRGDYRRSSLVLNGGILGRNGVSQGCRDTKRDSLEAQDVSSGAALGQQLGLWLDFARESVFGSLGMMRQILPVAVNCNAMASKNDQVSGVSRTLRQAGRRIPNSHHQLQDCLGSSLAFFATCSITLRYSYICHRLTLHL